MIRSDKGEVNISGEEAALCADIRSAEEAGLETG